MKNLKYLKYTALLLLGTCGITVKAMNSDKPKIMLVGASGKQAQEYFDLLKDFATFTAFVTSNPQLIKNKAEEHHSKLFTTLEEALDSKQNVFDVALIALPHYLHLDATKKVLAAGKTVIKEKPLALMSKEIDYYRDTLLSDHPSLFTIVQRHFQDSFVQALEYLPKIGKITDFKYQYSLMLPETAGWRAEKTKSGGGVILDMGYHVLDVINNFFGMPQKVTTEIGYCFNKMLAENLEDVALINLQYDSGINGIVLLNRHAPRIEEFIIRGTEGTIIVTPRSVTITLQEKIPLVIETTKSKEEEKRSMFLNYLNNRNNKVYAIQEFTRHENTVKLIEQIYANAVSKGLLTKCEL